MVTLSWLISYLLIYSFNDFFLTFFHLQNLLFLQNKIKNVYTCFSSNGCWIYWTDSHTVGYWSGVMASDLGNLVGMWMHKYKSEWVSERVSDYFNPNFIYFCLHFLYYLNRYFCTRWIFNIRVYITSKWYLVIL